MVEKIIETKVAILDRIKKAVLDETKSISPEALEKMSMIVDNFDKTEDYKSTPKFDYEKMLEKAIGKVKEPVEAPTPVVEEGV